MSANNNLDFLSTDISPSDKLMIESAFAKAVEEQSSALITEAKQEIAKKEAELKDREEKLLIQESAFKAKEVSFQKDLKEQLNSELADLSETVVHLIREGIERLGLDRDIYMDIDAQYQKQLNEVKTATSKELVMLSETVGDFVEQRVNAELALLSEDIKMAREAHNVHTVASLLKEVAAPFANIGEEKPLSTELQHLRSQLQRSRNIQVNAQRKLDGTLKECVELQTKLQEQESEFEEKRKKMLAEHATATQHLRTRVDQLKDKLDVETRLSSLTGQARTEMRSLLESVTPDKRDAMYSNSIKRVLSANANTTQSVTRQNRVLHESASGQTPARFRTQVGNSQTARVQVQDENRSIIDEVNQIMALAGISK